MYSNQPRPFTASTNKFAYAQAFSAKDRRHSGEHTSLLRRIATRRNRNRSV